MQYKSRQCWIQSKMEQMEQTFLPASKNSKTLSRASKFGLAILLLINAGMTIRSIFENGEHKMPIDQQIAFQPQCPRTKMVCGASKSFVFCGVLGDNDVMIFGSNNYLNSTILEQVILSSTQLCDISKSFGRTDHNADIYTHDFGIYKYWGRTHNCKFTDILLRPVIKVDCADFEFFTRRYCN